MRILVCNATFMRLYDEAAADIKQAVMVAETVAQHFADHMGVWRNHLEGVLGVLHQHTDLSPEDLEARFGLVGGDIFHGQMTLDQLYWARPAMGYANYRSPMRGVYLCAAGAHPGGGVSGAPGHNAAQVMLTDLRAGRV